MKTDRTRPLNFDKCAGFVGYDDNYMLEYIDDVEDELAKLYSQRLAPAAMDIIENDLALEAPPTLCAARLHKAQVCSRMG